MDLSRRHVLGLGAVALGALRFPVTANAKAKAPRLFELGIGSVHSSRWHLTKPLKAPDRFDLVGLRWNKGAHVHAQVRARTEGGRWTRWTALPHPHLPLDGTDPAFTGTADELQFRLRGEASKLTARFVRSLDAAPRAPRARASQAAPLVIPRDSWGAAQVPPRGTPAYGTVQAAFVHHTAGQIAYAPEESPGIVLGIARYHIESNGWNDIGYNFLVDRYGNVFEGRAGGIEQAVIGAQAQGFNDDTTGIACLGTFTATPLDEAGFDALAKIIGWKLSIHGVPVTGQVTLISGGGATNRHPSGAPVVFERISGHRDSNETSCPGDQLYAQLPALRTRATSYAFSAAGITVKAASQKGTKPVSVSGQLRFADGSSPAGASLSVEYTTAGSAWTPIGTTNAAADGAWATAVTLPSSGQVRAVFAGDGTRPRLESTPVTVKVVPSLVLTTDKRRARAGTAFAVSGTLSPGQGRVECLLERQVRGRWTRVQRKRINVRGGRFATKVRPKTPGLYRVSIIADGVTRRRTLRALR
ncbi:N-acetylmuramoyl-L-alanine amidase [Solirubrobacter sp. CPCC 204708]|uniref:N-acetylmuramoyl-L-alanine amidase n=1 Tax=Solirubrobacter deserti TaxID=2282478 RepID=A0ABT4RVB6_9ACTN|nr:N-acetylmuramoyl-L-alanine amidase [Solirubrobacter deserti]MBE2315149.1 N-acetylmuramoyl-L-alanine amidase [Solirubrobacter deserti]MDA0142400.1 N-acetylmuramoyl-L-alanine amidase [Solirubrobacter deserti]